MRDILLRNQLLVGMVIASQDAYDIALRDLEQGMVLFLQAVRALIPRRHPFEAAPSLVTAQGGIKQVVWFAGARAP